jgi:hypothetical protein
MVEGAAKGARNEVGPAEAAGRRGFPLRAMRHHCSAQAVSSSGGITWLVSTGGGGGVGPARQMRIDKQGTGWGAEAL